MKRYVLLTIVILGFTTLASAQWQSINSFPTYSNPVFNCTHYSLGAIASNFRIYWAYSANCAAGGMGQFCEYEIYATADLGNSWFSKVYQNSDILYLKTMEFISGDTGCFIHNTDYYTSSHLFRTSDYLTNYQNCYSTESFTYMDLDMISYNDLFILDTEAKILHLENDTLKLIYDLPVEFNEWNEDPTISATPGHYLFISCKSYPYNSYGNNLILSSYDGGYNWDTSFISTSVHINTLKFSSDNLGFAIGNGGVIMRTQDAGQTWENMNSGTLNNLLCLDFMNEQTWMIGGTNATLLLTEDSGETWSTIYVPPSTSSVGNVKFPEKNEIVFISYLGLKRASIYNFTKVPSQIITSQYFNIYPNPAKDHFTIEIRNPELKNTYAEICNLLGNKTYSQIITHEQEVIDCSNFPKGIYLVRVVNQGKHSIQRLVIQ